MYLNEKITRLLSLIANLINVFNTQKDLGNPVDDSNLQAYSDFIDNINLTKLIIDDRLEE